MSVGYFQEVPGLPEVVVSDLWELRHSSGGRFGFPAFRRAFGSAPKLRGLNACDLLGSLLLFLFFLNHGLDLPPSWIRR